MALPILTTAEDVTEVIRYLKNKPTGSTIEEARAAIKKQVLDPRKLSAYQLWGLVSKEGNRLKLTTRGWDFARKPESAQDVYKRIIDTVPPYKSVLEWAYHQGLDAISNVDVAAHWHEHHPEALGTDNENTIKDNAVCFFHVCHAAGLGTLIIGRKGQATRLELNKNALATFIESGPTTPPWNPPTEKSAPDTTIKDSSEDRRTADLPSVLPNTPTTAPEGIKVFISHGSNMDLVEQVQTMLQIADIENEVAVKEESSAIPVPKSIRCNETMPSRHHRGKRGRNPQGWEKAPTALTRMFLSK